jgi:hypothetical protein
MKTPYLDKRIPFLKKCLYNGFADQLDALTTMEELAELEAIKSLIENSPIVSTPDNPVWVVDGSGDKRILLADLGEKALNGRYILVSQKSEKYFFNNDNFNWFYSKIATPYTPKVNIEVTEEEAIKVEKFLKSLRDGKI